MKKIILILLLPFAAFAQKKDSITLDYCQKKAIENYPLIKQKDLLNKASEIKLFNITKTSLPLLSLNGQATYQSAVTELPIHIPGVVIPTLDKDMYKATLDIVQPIYSGGLTAKQKKLEEISLKSDLQDVETELYKIKDKVNTIYFSIVALQENKKQLLLLKDDIENKLKTVESGITNGTLLESNEDILKAELLKNDEQITELESGISSGFKMLADYVNKDIPDETILSLPDTVLNLSGYENFRPETKAFDLKKQEVDISKSLLDSKLLPKVAGFGELGLGRPGLNMLSNTFDPFYMFGVKFSWTFWDWHQTKNEKQLLDISSDVISSQKESFNLGVKILLEKNIADIQKYKDMMMKDNEIIVLREKIVKEASSQLQNGIITATEYLTDLNAAAQAKIDLQYHKIELAKAQVDYLTTKGKY